MTSSEASGEHAVLPDKGMRLALPAQGHAMSAAKSRAPRRRPTSSNKRLRKEFQSRKSLAGGACPYTLKMGRIGYSVASSAETWACACGLRSQHSFLRISQCPCL